MTRQPIPRAAAALLATTAALAAGTTVAAASERHAELAGYALAENGAALVTMASLAEPWQRESVALDVRLDAIAHRPVTGDLLGFSRDGSLYTIDPATGALSDLDAAFAEDAATAGPAVAFDFNNAIDAVRIVGADGANLVYFPSDFGDERAGSVRRFTDTFYAEDDRHAGTAPLIFANAYTNAVPGRKAESTVQYALDARTDALVNLANNDGALTTVAPVTLDGEPADLVSAGGFDIASMEEGADTALAILQIDGADTSGLYALDLETGAARLLADLGMTGITGFAVSVAAP